MYSMYLPAGGLGVAFFATGLGLDLREFPHSYKINNLLVVFPCGGTVGLKLVVLF